MTAGGRAGEAPADLDEEPVAGGVVVFLVAGQRVAREEPQQGDADQRHRQQRGVASDEEQQGWLRVVDERGWRESSESRLPLDISAAEDAITIEAALPGVPPEDVEITVHQDTLTIGVKEDREREGTGDGHSLAPHPGTGRRASQRGRRACCERPCDALRLCARLRDARLL